MARSENFLTIPVRIAFTDAVFTPKAYEEGSTPKYGVMLLFPKDETQRLLPSSPEAYGEKYTNLMGLRKILFATLKQELGPDKTKWPSRFEKFDPRTGFSETGQDGWPLRDGDSVKWEGFAGMAFVRATSLKVAPGVIDGKKREIINPAEVFGGLIARAQFNVFTFETKGRKGVSTGLQNLQIMADDGVSFSGRTKAADAFEEFGEAYPPEAVNDDIPF